MPNVLAPDIHAWLMVTLQEETLAWVRWLGSALCLLGEISRETAQWEFLCPVSVKVTQQCQQPTLSRVLNSSAAIRAVSPWHAVILADLTAWKSTGF